MSSLRADGAASLNLWAPPRPAKPEKCRKQTRKRLKSLKGPKAKDGFVFHPDVLERKFIMARCELCRACDLF